MSALTFIKDVGEKAKESAHIIVSKLLPNGQLEGDDWVSLNPTRNDNTLGSFKICVKGGNAGIWSDFAVGDKGGDLVSLYAYIKPVNGDGRMFVAARELNDKFSLGVDLPPQEQRKNAGKGRKFPRPKGTKPDFVYTYRKADGSVHAEVLRFNANDEFPKKHFQQRQPHKAGMPDEWKKPPPPNPVFRADEIANLLKALPEDGKVFFFVSEGEKSAMAISKALENNKNETSMLAFSTCWMGGTAAQNITDTDWSIFANRPVFLLPDDDLPGRKAMIKTAQVLESVRADPYIIDIFRTKEGKSKRDGSDALADDPNWDFRQAVRAYVKDNPDLLRWQQYGEKLQGLDNKSDAEIENDIKAKRRAPDLDHPFRALGMGLSHTDGAVVYHFLSIRKRYDNGNGHIRFTGTGNVHTFRPDQFKENNLLSMAEYSYWKDTYSTKAEGGIPWRQLTNALIQECQNIGFVDVNDIKRGRGVWKNKEDDCIIAHFGDMIFNTGKKQWDSVINGTSKKAIYINSTERPIEYIPPDDPDDVFESLGKYIDIVSGLDWQNKIIGEMVACWAMMSPFCGALSFRPHLYLTGQSGAGKSEILKNIIQPMLDTWVVKIEGNSTEAGVRNAIGNDAFPLTFDESDVKQGRDAITTAQNILHLARISSTETEGGIVHAHAKYKPRSMFCFGAVIPLLNDAADKNRFIRAHLGILNKEDRLKRWNETLLALDDIGLSRGGKLPAKSFWLWMYSLDAMVKDGGLIDAVGRNLSERGINARDSQRLSGCLSFLLMVRTRGEVLTHFQYIAELLDERIDEIRSMCEIGLEDSEDEQFVQHLMSMQIKRSGGSADRSLGWMINEYMKQAETMLQEDMMNAGVKITRAKDGADYLFIKNVHDRIYWHFNSTRWANGGHKSALKNMGAIENSVRMHKLPSRGYSFLIEKLGYDPSHDSDDLTMI